MQTEKAADPGCAAVDFFNKRETRTGSNTAVSSFAKLTFGGPELLVEYLDEDNLTWGAETWRADQGRLRGEPFQESDGYDDRAAATSS